MWEVDYIKYLLKKYQYIFLNKDMSKLKNINRI